MAQLSVVDGRSAPVAVSRSMLEHVAEDGQAAVDMAKAAIERARRVLFGSGNRGAIDTELRRALFELDQLRPDLVKLGEAAKTTT